MYQPLADALRPQELSDVCGQVLRAFCVKASFRAIAA